MFRSQLRKTAAWVMAVGSGGMFAHYALTAVLVFAAVGKVECASFAVDDAPMVPAPLIRSAGSGLWSEARTWEGGKVPDAGDRVQVRTGHRVVYDLSLPIADFETRSLYSPVLRSIHVAGTLTFARDRNTRLNVGLIKIQAGDDASEDGFNCDAHLRAPDPQTPRPALEVGTAEDPIPAKYTALIELTYVEGLDRESCPAIVCCGGRMDLHGAPMDRTWVKLGATANLGDTDIRLAEPVTGWRVGDRLIVTSTGHRNGNDLAASSRPGSRSFPTGDPPLVYTEERKIKEITRDRITLDRPLHYQHLGDGDYRGEVANLSRNVIVKSANPNKYDRVINNAVRGHTMYHKYSAGSISYAEFRHLGKEGVLGKYPIHIHLAGDTMRGSYVQGASIWDSGNRWVTVHGTNYLIVRDCVGYQSVGHGYFLEDGSETSNVLDRNLAVQSFNGKPLPKQELPFDQNDGAGFWWANNRNTFTRNVAVECDNYGFHFEATPTKDFDLTRPVMQPDGSIKPVDIRTLPFVRFDGNEAHDVRWGITLGESLARKVSVVMDEKHPLLLRNTRIWNTFGAFNARTRYAVNKMTIASSAYGMEYPFYDMAGQLSDPSAEENDAKTYWGAVVFERVTWPVALGLKSGASKVRGEDPRRVAPLDTPRPEVPDLIDDFPPVTVITHVRNGDGTTLIVRGTTTDNDMVKKVLVNGQEAKTLAPNFAEWEVTLKDMKPGAKITAHAEDTAGNIETRPHVLILNQ